MIQIEEHELKYLNPLIDRWKNHYWSKDYALFDFKDQKKATILTKKVDTNDIIPNFTRGFFDSWKETVDNWEKLFDSKSPIKDGKISSQICSVVELINNYKNQIKVNDCYNNPEKYKNYLKENKELYLICDWGRTGFINTLEILPEEFKKDLNQNGNYNYWIKEKQFKDDNKVIHPLRRTYGDNFVIFMDFFEEIKEIWKANHPNAIKVIIRKQGLKRFFGITDINPETNYYHFSTVGMSESQFQETTMEYFFLYKDGTLKGSQFSH